MNNDNLSYGLHDQTERPGQKLPLDAHTIIKNRYLLAEKLAVNKNVLEVGAGHGIAVNFLSKAASNYIAGEYSEENIELIKNRNLKNVNVVQMDAHKLPFKDNSFDLLIAMAMIYYLDINKFIKEASGLLKPNGILFFCTSNKNVAGFVPAPYTTDYYSVPELNSILNKNGYDVKFYGAFPAPGKTGIYRKTRVFARNIAKYLLFKLPWGVIYWESMRNKSLGGLKELPWNLEDIQAEEVNIDSLDPSVVDRNHRIIYCTAKLIN